MQYPIYVPSRGRFTTATTPVLLTMAGLDYFLVVEKKEFDDYVKYFPLTNIISLPGSDYGSLGFARNFTKEHAKKRGHQYHWQLDDDFTAVFQHRLGKKDSTPMVEIFNHVEAFVAKYSNIGQVGFSATNFLRQKVKEYQLNTYTYGVLLVNNGTKSKHRMHVTDLDYNLQLLFEGYCTVRFDCFAFSTPTMSSRPGGCTGTPREQQIKNTLKLWPDIIPGIVQKGDAKGNVKIRLNTNSIWHRFKKSPALLER